jgi:hypothetical protein
LFNKRYKKIINIKKTQPLKNIIYKVPITDYLTENKKTGKNTVLLSGGYPHDFIKYHHSLQDLNMELFICDDKNKYN